MPASDREEALRELGRIARERRENAQVSLENVYERTRIRLEYLRGIEHGNYQNFPDIVYTKGFVRTYLGMIGADDLRRDFTEWLDKDNAPKARNLPPTNILGNTTPPPKGYELASRFWLFLALALVLAGAGGFVWYSWDSNPIIITVHNNKPAEPNPTSGVISGEVSFDKAPLVISPDHNLLSILPASASIAVEPAKPEPPYIYIRARGDVWMSVAIGEKVVYRQTLKTGAGVSWDLTARATVTYGRPNMAEVVLNGKNLGVPNPRGAKTSETYLYDPDGTFRQKP